METAGVAPARNLRRTAPVHRPWQFCPHHGQRLVHGNCHLCGSSPSPQNLRRRGVGTSDAGGPESSAQLSVQSAAAAAQAIPRQKWRKILYEDQPYEDNFVSDSFLGLMQMNVNKRVYGYGATVQESTSVTQQISTVAWFVIMFYYAFNESVSVSFMVTVDALMSAMGWMLYLMTDTQVVRRSNYWRFFLTMLAFWVFAPVLRTLTDKFSSDTIWAMTSIFLILHVVFQDYGYINGLRSRYSAPVSLNAAIFSSVLLASRLKSDLHAFAFVTYAGMMETTSLFAKFLFALGPVVRKSIRNFSIDMYCYVTVIQVVITLGFLFPISKMIAIMYLAIIAFISLISPLWLVWIQRYKSEISGPWDEATLKAPPQRRFDRARFLS